MAANTATAIIVGVFLALLGFIAWLAQRVIAHKGKELFLQKENSKLEKEYSATKEKIATLQEQISKYTHKEKFLSNYPPDSNIPIRREKSTGRPVCNLCIQQENPIISYLERISNSWYCRHCKTPFK